MQSFFLEGSLAYAVTVSGAGRTFFLKQLKRLQFFDPGGKNFLRFTVFARAVCDVYTLPLRRERSTILEGQRLGTLHIMDGTCSQA